MWSNPYVLLIVYVTDKATWEVLNSMYIEVTTKGASRDTCGRISTKDGGRIWKTLHSRCLIFWSMKEDIDTT